jgi:hypothetical protein
MNKNVSNEKVIYSNKISLAVFISMLLLLLFVLVVMSIGYPVFLILLLGFLGWMYFKLLIILSVTVKELKVFTLSGVKKIGLENVKNVSYFSGPLFNDHRSVNISFVMGGDKECSATFNYVSRFHVCDLLNHLRGKVSIDAKSFRGLGVIEKGGLFVVS